MGKVHKIYQTLSTYVEKAELNSLKNYLTTNSDSLIQLSPTANDEENKILKNVLLFLAEQGESAYAKDLWQKGIKPRETHPERAQCPTTSQVTSYSTIGNVSERAQNLVQQNAHKDPLDLIEAVAIGLGITAAPLKRGGGNIPVPEAHQHRPGSPRKP
jgi:hypothetical protein